MMGWPKGKPRGKTWNKGLTKEICPRIARTEKSRKQQSLTLRRMGHRPPNRKGIPAWNKGLTKDTSPVIAKMATCDHNPYPGLAKMCGWNRGLTSETDSRVARNSLAISVAHKGKPFPGDKAKVSASVKRWWASLSQEERSNRVKKMHEAARRTKKAPNKPEALLNELLNTYWPNQWKFVGNGQLIIDNLNPDFANINGRKQLIELFGTYWHKGQNPQDRIDRFAKFGYNCMVIWEHEIKSDFSSVVARVATFSEIGTKEMTYAQSQTW